MAMVVTITIAVFDMTILFCLMLELDRFLLTLLMSTIANLTMAIAREVFIYRHVFIQVRSTCVLTGMSARRRTFVRWACMQGPTE